MKVPFHGVLAVFQTPYHEDESIDFEVLRREIDWLFEKGVDGIVMAMVSEVLRLSHEERKTLAVAACTGARDHGGTSVISVGAESCHTAVHLARHAERAGATALMAIPPISIELDEKELKRYYEAIIESVKIPVVVQDASGYVGKPMSIAMQADLMKEFGAERVLFKPEAEPIGPRLSELLEATGREAVVFEGSGGMALVDSWKRGIAGTMPGADLIEAIVPLWKALQDGDMVAAEKIHGPLSALVAIQTGLDGFLAVEKHLLKRRGVFENEVIRGPVGFHLDEQARREVDRLFDELMAVLKTI